jgi:hypothetical protein
MEMVLALSSVTVVILSHSLTRHILRRVTKVNYYSLPLVSIDSFFMIYISEKTCDLCSYHASFRSRSSCFFAY